MIPADSFVYLKLTLASGATALGSVIDANPTFVELTHYRRLVYLVDRLLESTTEPSAGGGSGDAS
jgi:hypothetical protein